MANSKYTLYKYVKVSGERRYLDAAHHDNGKIKRDIVFVNVEQALLERHPEGRYYMSHNGQESGRAIGQRLPYGDFAPSVSLLTGSGGV
jgi:hypothetical protein